MCNLIDLEATKLVLDWLRRPRYDVSWQPVLVPVTLPSFVVQEFHCFYWRRSVNLDDRCHVDQVMQEWRCWKKERTVVLESMDELGDNCEDHDNLPVVVAVAEDHVHSAVGREKNRLDGVVVVEDHEDSGSMDRALMQGGEEEDLGGVVDGDDDGVAVDGTGGDEEAEDGAVDGDGNPNLVIQAVADEHASVGVLVGVVPSA